MKRILLISGTALLVTVVGFYFFNKRKAMQLVLPDLNRIYFLQGNVTNDTAYIVLKGVIENKSPYEMDISSVEYKVSLDTGTVIRERQQFDLKIPSGEKDTLMLRFRIPVKGTRKLIKGLQGWDSCFIKGDFTVNYETIFGNTSLDFSVDEKIKTPVPPEFRIVKTERKKTKLFKGTTELDIYLEIINKGENLDLNLSNVRYTVVLGEHITGKGRLQQRVAIKPKSSVTVVLPLDLKSEKPASTLVKLLTDNDRMNYTLHVYGNLDAFGESGVPVEFHTSGITELKK